MLLLGHMGITLATAQMLNCAILRNKHLSAEAIHQTEKYREEQSRKPRLIEQIDIRLLLLGSLLPDIIDKPIGHILLRNTLDNGRIYCHTLLFAIVISLVAFFLWKQKHKSFLLPVAFGVLMHLILDEMWLMHHTLLWPLYGWTFPRGDWDFYWGDILHNAVSYPRLYISEIIGGLLLLWYTIPIVRKKKVLAFLRKGRL